MRRGFSCCFTASFVVAIGFAATSPQPAAAQAKPKPKPLVLEESPSPTSVQATHVHKLAAAPLRQLAVAPLPAYLQEAVVLTRPIAKYAADPEAGKLKVEVQADGPLFLAVGERYDGFAPDGSMWHDYKFRDAGWVPLMPISLISTATLKPEVHVLYLRECRQGETIAVRPRVNYPPLLIVPAAGAAVPSIAALEPDPTLPEHFQYNTVRGQAVALLDAERIDELDALLNKFIDTDAHFPSGRAKFTEAYHPFSFPLSGETEASFVRRVAIMEKWIAAKPQSLAAKLVLFHCLGRFQVFLSFSKLVENGSARAEEAERRQLELLHEAEQSGSTSPQLYAALLSRYVEGRWDEARAAEYLAKMLPASRWCPEVIFSALTQLSNWRLYEGLETAELRKAERKKKVDALFALTKQHLSPKFGDAMYAAAFVQYYIVHPADAFQEGNFDWARARGAFEDWNRVFPNSPRIRQLFARYACAAGDHEAARKMFDLLGNFQYDIEEVWSFEPDLLGDRAWAAADFASGDQRRLFENPSQTIGGIAWSGDGKQLLWAEGMGRIYRAADADDAKREFVREATVQSAQAMRTSRDGHRALVGSYFRNLAWLDLSLEIGTLNSRRSLKINHGTIEHVALSADGLRAVAGNNDGVISLFDLTDPAERMPKHEPAALQGKTLRTVAFTADEKQVLSVASDGTVVIHDFATGAEQARWTMKPAGCGAAATSADGKHLLAARNGNRLTLYDAADGATRWEITMTGPAPTRAAVSPDGRVVAVGTGASWRVGPQEVRLYSAADGKLLKTYAGHKAGLTDLVFSPDGRTLASSSLDRSIRLWDVPQE